MTKGNSEKLTATCTRRQGEALNRLDRIREAARRDKNLRFTSLMHHITVDLLRGKRGTGLNLGVSFFICLDVNSGTPLILMGDSGPGPDGNALAFG